MMRQLYTRWGKNLDKDHVLQEYPRPLMVRNSYINLNGYWDYAFTKSFRQPGEFDGKILVPFSPESVLSGVSRQLMPEEYLWYRRTFELAGWRKRADVTRLILHFGAVDQACAVYVNGRRAMRHTGGYLTFEGDISRYVREGENELVVAVKDLSDTSYHARGKQRLKRGGMFYTAQSGIWQTVWMEEVPQEYITRIQTISDIKRGRIRIRIEGRQRKEKPQSRKNSFLPVEVQIQNPRIYHTSEKKASTVSNREETGRILCTGTGIEGVWMDICIPHIAPWSCDYPYLYYFTVRMGEDTVESYFAMREFSLKRDERGIPRICLNGRPQFQNGVLDQGYWPDGLYTAPSDEAMIFDITEMKKTGFNMVRKHVKIEPQRWYYHCDRFGMAVWQDMVNGGGSYRHWFVTYAATLLSLADVPVRDLRGRLMSREGTAGKKEYIREMKETISQLKGHPSIAVWVLFNEGWGQFDARHMAEIAKRQDPFRLIDHASGWFDQRGGDIKSVHNYFFRLTVKQEKRRAFALTEIGGKTFVCKGHTACDKRYGYGGHKDMNSLHCACKKLSGKVRNLIAQGLCASVYTQWSDVEEEINGVFTYDREVRKIRKLSAD